ncbi:MAG: valine--tRNA ligase [Patescibacteria group bacterium]|jgi:valyl-tRNA synthetase
MSKGIDLPKAYEAKQVEDGISATWMQSGFFSPENLPERENRREPFSIILPPPNVTGTLHMGHAVMLAIEDAMVRFARMSGKNAVWIPGTDHAAIATESKVEKMLIEKEGKTRHDLGREAFLRRVEAFAKESHDTIVNQMKKMGASVDWSREAYTLDEKRHDAVNTAFLRMYKDGLIYRGYRVINWDPVGKTAVSDEEVEYKEGTATLYTFRYGKDVPIAISTTRPETKVGDTAIAVHPDDPRYQAFIGKEFDVAFAGTTLHLRVIADACVDREFGTGALGVTPAHSLADADLAHVHELPMIQVIDESAHMTQEAGTLVAGKSTLEARALVIEWLREEGLLLGEEEVSQNLSYAQRSGGVIEPLPKEQWFIDVNKSFHFRNSTRHPIDGVEDGQEVSLKSLMQHVVRSGQIKIIPDRFSKTYFHWIDHLRDWNISRQIWFGHRLPVWYRNTEVKVSVTKPEGEGWERDPDTLDTWFSSGLWTFSTLGWPNESSPDLLAYHPTTVMETGYDILFFWVARMILMSTYLLGEIPFETVYLHGLVLDEEGRKMSKSLGNVLNPLDMIDRYGADATRLSLLIGSTPGNDMKISEEKVAGFRNFTNKLWNISRFVFLSVDDVKSIEKPPVPKTLADRWILGRFSEVEKKVTHHFEAHEFSFLGETLRDFTWNEFADWYLEIAKIEKGKEEILLYILERLLLLWHPFMPFVTEELSKNFGKGLALIAPWPVAEYALASIDQQAMMELQEIITAIRSVRSTYHVNSQVMLDIVVDGLLSPDVEPLVKSLAKVASISSFQGEKPAQAAVVLVGEMEIYVKLEGFIDVQKEITHVEEELAEAKRYMQLLEQKLGNTAFVEHAPAAVVEEERAKREATFDRIQKLEQSLHHLSHV